MEFGRKKSLTTVVISLLVMGVALIIPEWATTLFMLIFVVNLILLRSVGS